MRPDVLANAIDATAGEGDDEALIYLYAARCAVNAVAGEGFVRASPPWSSSAAGFEGVDERVIQAREMEEISIGDFVLSGGEPAAIALIDACVRLQPGVDGRAGRTGRGEFRRRLVGISALHPTQSVGKVGRCRRFCCRDTMNGFASGATSKPNKSRKRRRPDLWRRYVREQDS